MPSSVEPLTLHQKLNVSSVNKPIWKREQVCVNINTINFLRLYWSKKVNYFLPKSRHTASSLTLMWQNTTLCCKFSVMYLLIV